MMQIRLFLGAVVVNKDVALCAAVIKAGGGYQRLPELAIEEEGLTEHRAVLLTIDRILRSIGKPKAQITVYTSCEEAAFEWREEYKKDHTFCKSTADQDAWKRIVNYTEGTNIILDIKGQDSPLTALAALEQERIKNHE